MLLKVVFRVSLCWKISQGVGLREAGRTEEAGDSGSDRGGHDG